MRTKKKNQNWNIKWSNISWNGPLIINRGWTFMKHALATLSNWGACLKVVFNGNSTSYYELWKGAEFYVYILINNSSYIIQE